MSRGAQELGGHGRAGDIIDPCALPAFGSLWYAKVCGRGGNNSAVQCDLAKVEVAGSNPVSRSILRSRDTLASFGWRANFRAKDVHHSGAAATVDHIVE